jgi:two-component system, response regulator PdtaR
MSKKVLIVEDEYLVSHLLENYVRDAGCCSVVGSVDNGDEAIKLAKECKPDLILMDVRIEGDKDGIETANLISKENNIPIIYTSGNSDEKTKERARRTNMLDFLVKPINKEQLIRLLCPGT